MPEPPVPTIPSLLLAAAAKLAWHATARDPNGVDLGVFTDTTGNQSFIIEGTSPGSCAWAIVATLPAGFGPFLMSESTYNVLHGGTLNTDGSIAYGGRSYRVRSFWDGAEWTAAAVAA
jgi:hypothetical protein